jgi:hypothetical protein
MNKHLIELNNDELTIVSGGAWWLFQKRVMAAICSAVCIPLPEPAKSACVAACDLIK